MDNVLLGYEVNEPTWFYLSFLLIVAVFFRFSKFLSLRNLDLLLLLMLSPGLLLVEAGGNRAIFGYMWLFVVTAGILIRLILDTANTRRPRVLPNLNAGGLGVLCVSAIAFQAANIMAEPPHASTMETVRRADRLIHRHADPAGAASGDFASVAGPTASLVATPVVPLSEVVAAQSGAAVIRPGDQELIAARILAILSHIAVIAGLIAFGRYHMGDGRIGLAMATLYLLVPCTAFDASKVNHVLPATFVVWAFVMHRRPILAGTFLGFACGSLFFAVFVLPLWLTYYRGRQKLQFLGAVAAVGALLLSTLWWAADDGGLLTAQTIGSVNLYLLQFSGTSDGFWQIYNSAYRLPVIVAFLLMVVALTAWPFRKRLDHLLAYSTAIIVGTQFWYPEQGGVYVLWYLPLFILVSYRPRALTERENEAAAGHAISRPADQDRPVRMGSSSRLTGPLFR